MNPLIPLLMLAAAATSPQKTREFLPLGDPRIPAELSQSAGWAITQARAENLRGRPIAKVTCAVKGQDESLWLCSAQGLLHRRRDGSWEYLAGKRYLLDDNVLNVLPGVGQVWVRTQSGVSRIDYRPMTLEEKAAWIERRIPERFDRYGFVASREIDRQYPTDNDGLWTAMYIGAEAFRFGATRSPEARARARRSMEAVMRLESITGIPGFPARAYIRRGDYRHKDGAWHFTADGQFEWKGDTSSDEVVGHYFAYAVYYDLVAEESEKPAIRAVVDRITTHLLDHNYALIDVTGKPTTWAQYAPEHIAKQPDEFALNSMLLLSHLRTAYHITGKPRFLEEYRKLVGMGYARNTARYLETRQEINHSDEEMALLGFYPLFKYEDDRQLRALYRRGLEQWWQSGKLQKNPFWIYFYNFCAGRKVRLDEAAWALERIPLDLVAWTVQNSHRADVRMDSAKDRFDRPQAITLLPPDERPVSKWNANPFRIDGGNGGRSEDDGAFYLLPYWMGRYLGFLK